MRILTAEQIRKVDTYTIEHEPIKSIDLMERASTKCIEWIIQNITAKKPVKVFVGPGNNGGDGLAIARMLAETNWQVEVILLTSPERLVPDALENYKRLANQKNLTMCLAQGQCLPIIKPTDLIIDAMFGSGLTRSLEGLSSEIAQKINNSGAITISIDSPSGLYYGINPNPNQKNVICATHTLSFQLPKLSFFFAENEKYTGQWHLLDIKLNPEAIEQQTSNYHYITKKQISNIHKLRTTFSHKGNYGHALLFAGSFGMMGAAILSLRGCLRSGVGLVTLHTTELGSSIIQTTVPESIVSIDKQDTISSSLPQLEKYNAIGIGPGIGTHAKTAQLLLDLLKNSHVPLVIDADAINILASNTNWLSLLPESTILTPHPGEFDRLFGKSHTGYERHLKQLEFAVKHKIIIILKGAYTSIATPSGKCFFNSTGNAGMATAGSGDVLTGIVLSLLAQGYEPLQAAMMAPYLHGLAGDFASADNSPEALIASDIVEYLGKAFNSLKEPK